MHRISISLAPKATTAYAPLAAFGYALRRAGLLVPLSEVALPIKTLTHTPGEKLVEALVLILAGGRATSQIDLLLRPNQPLAQAWGQEQFAQQATVADTLDAFDDVSLAALRAAFETLLTQCSGALHHDFRTGDLWLDGDLTGLPASRRAEGSTKGYFAGEKTVSGGNWHGSASVPIGNRSAHCSTPVFSTVSVAGNLWSEWPNACCGLKCINALASFGASMPALAATTRSNGCWHAIINCWSKATTPAGHKRWRGRWLPRIGNRCGLTSGSRWCLPRCAMVAASKPWP